MRRIVVFCDGPHRYADWSVIECINTHIFNTDDRIKERYLGHRFYFSREQVKTNIPLEDGTVFNYITAPDGTLDYRWRSPRPKPVDGLVSLRLWGQWVAREKCAWIMVPISLRDYLSHELGIVCPNEIKPTYNFALWRDADIFSPVFEAEIFESGRGLWTPPADRRDTHKEAKAVQISVCPDGAPVWLPYEGEAIKAENVQGSTAPKKQGFAAHIGATEACGEPPKAKGTPLPKVSKRGRKAARDGGKVNEHDFKKDVCDLIKEGRGDAEIAQLINQKKEDYEDDITASKVRTVRRWFTNNPDYFLQKYGTKGGKKKK